MPEDFEDELKSIFDAVENPETHLSESCPDCEDLATINDRYERLEVLGEGGVKQVLEVIDHRSKRNLAYAEPKKELHPLFYDMILQEAWLTASLQHPNIIKIHDVGINKDKQPYFTMDLKQGQNLSKWRSSINKDSFDLEQCLDIFVTLCEAIEHAHSVGILHLDLKPDNIQIESFSEVIVCDWGLGRRMDDGDFTHLKQQELLEEADSHIGGTPGYMAPEQIENNSSIDKRTDIYGLGTILYFLLSKHTPIKGDKPEELLRATCRGEIVPLANVPDSIKIPRTLEIILNRCLVLKPDHRYQTITELLTDIRAFRRFMPTRFQKNKPFVRAFLFYKRHQTLSSISFFFCIAIALGFWWVWGKVQSEIELRKSEQKRAEVAEEQFGVVKGEIENLRNEILSISEQEELSKKERADRINEIMIFIKERSMYSNIAVTVDAMEQFSRLSISLDADSHWAWHQMAEVHFIMLNTAMTKRILKHYKPKVKLLEQTFIQCPSLNFNRKKRPNFQELMQFIQAIEWNGHSHILVQRALLFDHAIRNKQEDYYPIVESYLKESLKQYKDTNIIYEKKKNEITIQSYRQVPGLVAPRFFLLSCLKVNKVKLVGDFTRNLTGLHFANIDELDLSEYTKVERIELFSKNISLNHLIVKKGMYPESVISHLRKYINKVTERP